MACPEGIKDPPGESREMEGRKCLILLKILPLSSPQFPGFFPEFFPKIPASQGDSLNF